VRRSASARFLFGKQVLTAEQATTPARRIYLAMQTAYVGRDDEREAALGQARTLIAAYGESDGPEEPRGLMRQALQAAEAGEHYEALKLARRVLRLEEADSVADEAQT
jgi:flagellar protein FlbT